MRTSTLSTLAGVGAAAILGGLVLVNSDLVAPPDYSRSAFRHWVDADHDCQDSRQEVLIRDSLVEVQLDEAGCRVLVGEWFDPYTGETFHDPGKLDVDHLVPLKEAWISGAHAWTPERRRLFANELDGVDWHLIAVKAGANRSKGAKDPAGWKPPDSASWCTYAENWTAVKLLWGLEADEAELDALAEMLGTCPGFP